MNLVDICKKQIRVVYYARVSTDYDEQIYALKNQVLYYEDQVKLHPNWVLVGRYIDEGCSGTSVKSRKKFLKMIFDAKGNAFDMIITREISRFARNTIDSLKYTRELLECGVYVNFIENNISTQSQESELMLTMLSCFAQEEARKTSMRVRATLKTLMRSGFALGNGQILGYNKTKGVLTVNEEQAKIVRLIFNLYASGLGSVRIGRELEKYGLKSPTGLTHWNPSTINNIIANQTYKGVLEYNKKVTPNFFSSVRKKNDGSVEKIVVRGDYEPIISSDLWEQCALIRKERTRRITRDGKVKKQGRKISDDFWIKKLSCGCGSHFSRILQNKLKSGERVYAYVCYSRSKMRTAETRERAGLLSTNVCEVSQIPEWRLNGVAAYLIKKHIKENISQIKTYLSNGPQSIKPIEIDDEEYGIAVESLEETVSDINCKLERLLDFYLDDVVSQEDYQRKNESLKCEVEKHEATLRELKWQKEVSAIHQKAPTDMINIIDQLANNPKADVPPEIVEVLVEKVKVLSNHRHEWYIRGADKPDICVFTKLQRGLIAFRHINNKTDVFLRKSNNSKTEGNDIP